MIVNSHRPPKAPESAGWRLSTRGGLPPLLQQFSEVTEAYQSLVLLVPEPEGERFEAGEQRDGRHGLEERFGFVTFFEVVVWYARTEVMDVVEADAAGEPLQDFGQTVERGAVHRGGDEIP